jgi:PAS domain S-box-containing protein
MAGTSPYRMTIPAQLYRVAEVREWIGDVGRLAGLSESRVFDLQVVTSEAVANGIEHAASEVETVAWMLPDRLLVEVTNDGVFQPGIYKDDIGRRRGLGLPLMVSLADEVHVSRLPGDRTRVSMTFLVSDAAALPNAQEVAGRSRFWAGGGLGWLLLPILLLMVLVVVFWGMGLTGAHDSQPLLMAFNTLFVSAACMAVAYSAGFSVLRLGSLAVLLLGTGSVVLALGFLLAGPLLSEPDALVTVHNTAVMLAGIMFAASGALALSRHDVRAVSRPALLLAAVYAASAALVVLVAVLAVNDITPTFLASGEYTAIRAAVLATAALAFLVAAFFYGLLYRKQASRFVVFAAGAFAYFCVGLGVLVLFEPELGSPVNWVGRAAQWMGGVYLLAAVYSLQRSGSSVLALERTLHEVEDRYQALVNTSPDAIVVHSDGRYIFANPAAVRLFGAASAEDLIGQEVTRLVHPDSVTEVLARIDQAYAGGISPPLEGRLLRLDDSAFDAEMSRSMVRFGGGLAIQTVIRDITARKQAEAASERDRTLVEGIAAIFEEALSDGDERDLGQVCLEISTRITGSEIGLIGELGYGGKLWDIAVSNPGWDACWPLDAHGVRRPPGDFEVHGLYGAVLTGGQTLLANDPASHPASVGLPPGHPPLDNFLGVPLVRHGETSGLIAVGDRPGGYGLEQQQKLEALAPVVVQAFDRKRGEAAMRESEEKYRALAVENERLYRQQLDIAETLQLALIDVPARIGRVRLGHLYRSATESAWVGGDFYDVFEVGDGRIALLIGDVSGHGIEAARTATLVKDVVHAFAHQSLQSHEVLAWTNQVLLEEGTPGFVSLFLGILDAEDGSLRYSSAGHPEPMLRRATGGVTRLDSRSSPLGVFADATWRSREAGLEPGDLLLLYTDGVTEARRDGELFGEQRLADLVLQAEGPVEQLPQRVLEAVLAFSAGRLKDDVAVLGLALE